MISRRRWHLGFVWANGYAHHQASFDKIPRQGGAFPFLQADAARRTGARPLYIAMFDELDECTQIFKVTNDPPTGLSRFLHYSPHAPGYSLWLTGEIGRLLRGETPLFPELPVRPPR